MKGVLKVSKEQVIEIERYCDEHGITRKQRIDELGLSHSAYYYTRGMLSEGELHGGQFIPIMSGSGLMQAASMPVGKSRRKQAESRNGWDQSAASVKLKTLNDSPYINQLVAARTMPSASILTWAGLYSGTEVVVGGWHITGINKYSEIGNENAVKM